MRIHEKPITVLTSGAILLLGVLCQPAHAGNTLYSGTATLADSFGAAELHPAQEDLTVLYSVTLSAGVYTYDYTVNNPAGDVLLKNNDTPTTTPGTPEEVSSFNVGFDATVPGAYVPNSISGGLLFLDQDNGVAGLNWGFNPVEPTFNSGTLSFQSDLPPTWGNANATDANAPSPWASTPGGEQVPVPSNVPEPTTTALLTGFLLLLPFRSTIIKKR